MTAELRIAGAVVVLAVLGYAAMWALDAQKAKDELRVLKPAYQRLVLDAALGDQLAADKIEYDARVDRGVSGVLDTNQEEARRDPTYREYVDRPLPEQSVRLYARAAAARAAAGTPGADGAGQADDEEDPGTQD